MGAISHICYPSLNYSENIGKDFKIEYLKKFAPPIDDIMDFCDFGKKELSCEEIFSEIITEEGLCYTFNTLDTIDLFKKDE